MASLADECREYDGTPLTLAAWFQDGCAVGFSCYYSEGWLPTDYDVERFAEVEACIQARFETERLDCAAELSCGIGTGDAGILDN